MYLLLNIARFENAKLITILNLSENAKQFSVMPTQNGFPKIWTTAVYGITHTKQLC